MKQYKLTKGTISRIRTNKAGVDELLKEGYSLDGEVVQEGNSYRVVSSSVVFDDDEKAKAAKTAREALEAEAVTLEVGSKKDVKKLSDDDLKAAIEKAKAAKA